MCRLRNDLLCVEWAAKRYILTHFLISEFEPLGAFSNKSNKSVSLPLPLPSVKSGWVGSQKWTHKQLWGYDNKTCCTTLRWLLTVGFGPGVLCPGAFVSETLPVSYVIFPFTLTRFNVRNLLQLPMDSCELTEWRRGTQVRVRSNHFALIGDGFRTTMS